MGIWIGAAAAFVVFYAAALFRNLNDFMSDYHWADITEAPRDGTWIQASEMLSGHPHCVEVRFINGQFEDGNGMIWSPEYFVKKGKKP